MAVVNTKGSVNISGLDSSPVTLPNVRTNGGQLRVIRDTVEVDATDDDTSTYIVARVASNVMLKDSNTAHDSITGGTDYDLGFYETTENGGAVISVDALVDGSDLSTGSRTLDSMSNVVIEDLHKQVWELAGLTKDPHTDIDIVWTANTVGTATGTITSTVEFS